MNKDFNHSYWETKAYLQAFDLIVIGAGIVGLSTAIAFKQKNKTAKVLILEKGWLPLGASTKNAGFACFGSPTELTADISSMSENKVAKIVEMRWMGLQLLRKRLGDRAIDYKPYGGFELFLKNEEYERTVENLPGLNKFVRGAIGIKTCYQTSTKFKAHLRGVKGIIANTFEGQLDTGKMMFELGRFAINLGIKQLNGITVTKISDENSHGVKIESDVGIFSSSRLAVATNGFAKELLKIKDIEPARAQVLITTPIPGLKLKGSFHFDKGYYYFRNIDNRVLFGGGRNLDFETEKTVEFGITPTIQNKLNTYLQNVILPNHSFSVEQRWSGIMGVGSEKFPIINFVSNNVLAVVRMGGMGVAIGSRVGQIAANKLSMV